MSAPHEYVFFADRDLGKQYFIFTFRQIIKFIEENPRPFIAKIYRPDQTKRKTKPESAGYVKLWVSF
jgi:hypothetical protein